jgi:hypothetical protein
LVHEDLPDLGWLNKLLKAQLSLSGVPNCSVDMIIAITPGMIIIADRV